MLNRTSRSRRTARTGYAYQPPEYERRRAACPEAPRTVRTGYACQPRACRTYHVPYCGTTQVMNRQSLTIFLDWLNGERGGVNVGGQRYAMRFVW